MKASELRIFIGYDSREPIAYAVLADSIIRRASMPVSITPLRLDSLRHVYTRARGATESTEFSLTRFLVPYLSNYDGLSLFLDCDMLMQADVAELLVYPLAYPDKAVHVCQHDYIPRDQVKFLGQVQTAYPRKNWSSVMLFDNAKCRALTPDYVNTATGLQLHRFEWLGLPLVCPVCSRAEGTYRKEPNRARCKCEACGKVFDAPVGVGDGFGIGSLPLEWNHLVNEPGQSDAEPKNIHFTRGGPWFPEYAECPYADRWLQALAEMHGQAVAA